MGVRVLFSGFYLVILGHAVVIGGGGGNPPPPTSDLFLVILICGNIKVPSL